MKKVIAIGEALIDMLASDTNDIKNVNSFMPKVGGAPLNVCGAISKLGGKSSIITMLGNDAFGDKIIDEIDKWNIDKSCVLRTNEANTALAFVSRTSDGGRDFSFYRKPSADMLLYFDKLEEEWFFDTYALHFCSVDLVECPMKYSHVKAIQYARKNNAIISFDPNLRFNLWDDLNSLKKTVNEFIGSCDILKISDEELEFISGTNDIRSAVEIFFNRGVKLVIYTCGAKGAYIYTKSFSIFKESIKVNAIDSTGAGDAFIGSFLYNLAYSNIDLDKLTKKEASEFLEFSTLFAGISVTKEGAIASYPTIKEINEFLKN